MRSYVSYEDLFFSSVGSETYLQVRREPDMQKKANIHDQIATQ